MSEAQPHPPPRPAKLAIDLAQLPSAMEQFVRPGAPQAALQYAAQPLACSRCAARIDVAIVERFGRECIEHPCPLKAVLP